MGNYLFYIPLFFPIFRYMHFNRNRFQMVLTYNQNQSYLIGSFLELDNDGASVSINNLNAGCFRSLVPPLSSSRLEVESNIGDKGRFIWDLNVCDKEANGDGRSRFPNNQYRVSSTIHESIKSVCDLYKISWHQRNLRNLIGSIHFLLLEIMPKQSKLARVQVIYL